MAGNHRSLIITGNADCLHPRLRIDRGAIDKGETAGQWRLVAIGPAAVLSPTGMDPRTRETSTTTRIAEIFYLTEGNPEPSEEVRIIATQRRTPHRFLSRSMLLTLSGWRPK